MAEDEDERLPLLRAKPKLVTQDINTITASAQDAADAHKLLQVTRYINANVPWLMVVNNTAKWMLHAFTVLGSYQYMSASWQAFTPKCWEYTINEVHLFVMCNITGFSFRTFPLFCAIVVVITFWRHLYESRLYYECLLHRILMNYDNERSFKSPLTWTFVLYGCLALAVNCFVSPHPLPLHVVSLRSTLTQHLIIYICPLLSFFILYLSVWQVESHLVPLPKFYEVDPELAREVLSQGTFAAEMHLRVAFEEVEEAIGSRQPEHPMTSAEYFGLIKEAVERERRRSIELSRNLPERSETWMDRVMGNFGLVRVDERFSHHTSTELSRPEVHSWLHSFRKGNWWVHRFLHSSHLIDERSVSFRRWAYVFISIASLFIVCVAQIYIANTVDWFKDQHLAKS